MEYRKRIWKKVCLLGADKEITLKNLQYCELRFPMCNICVRRGMNLLSEAIVSILT